MKFFKKHNYKYINGTKGAISLFLVMMMLPFFSLATFLAEYNRFQSAKLLLDNSINSAAVSVLSDYDYKIYEKYGLMSINPWTYDVKANFKNYLLNNLKGVSKDNIELTGDPTIVFDCPLSDTKVLKRQIAEYSKYNAPFAIANGKLCNPYILDNIKGNSLDSLKTLKNTLTTLRKALVAVQGMRDALEGIKSESDKLDRITDYDSKWKDFYDKTYKYSENLRDVYKQRGREARGQDLFPELRVAAENATFKYTTVCKELSDIVYKFEKHLISLDENKREYDDALTKAYRIDATGKASQNAKECLKKSLLKGRGSLEKSLKELEDYREKNQGRYKNRKWDKYNGFGEHVYMTLLEWDKRDIGMPVPAKPEKPNYLGRSGAKKYIEEIRDDTYKSNVVHPKKSKITVYYPREAYWHNFLPDNLRKAGKTAISARHELLRLGNSPNILSRLSSITNFFIDMRGNEKIFRDSKFEVKIDHYTPMSAFWVANFQLEDVMHKSAEVLRKQNIVEHIKEYIEVVDSIYNPDEKKFSLIREVQKILDRKNINYREVMTMSYFSSVLSNRFNYAPDDLVKGELEYVVVGSGILNLSMTFFSIYYTRFLLDIKPVLESNEILDASTVPYIGPIIMALFTIAEPMVDTLLLVNDTGVELNKANPYLSPSGIRYFEKRFADIKNEKEKIKNKAINLKNEKVKVQSCTLSGGEKENFSIGVHNLVNKMASQRGPSQQNEQIAGYEAHVFLMMILLGDEDTYLDRFANLVEIYGRKHHGIWYNVEKAWTNLNFKADAKVKTIFPLPTAIDKGTFKTIVEGNQTRGY